MQPYYADDAVTLYAGDCLAVLPTLPDCSVDAVVTDPPYNLSDSGKRDSDCLSRILSDVHFPNAGDSDSQAVEGRDFPVPSGSVAELNGEQGTFGINPRVGVPEGAIDLQGPTVREKEINHADKAAPSSPDRHLSTEHDATALEDFGNFVLQFTHGGDAPVCYGTCSCFTEPGPGLIAMTVRPVDSPSGPNLGVMFGGKRRRDPDVGVGNDATSQAKGSTPVVADARAIDAFVLRLDLTRGTGELSAAHGARALHAVPQLRHAEFVGTGSRAGGLPPMLEPYRVRFVGDAADGAITLYLPKLHAIKSTRAGGFMGKAWDGWSSPAAFQRWCQLWAAECLRVLKPGGHLLAFGGTRTWHRLACAIEDAGFEIRDSIAWLYGSGFPKSLAVDKAIDRVNGKPLDRLREFGVYVRIARETAGLTQADVNRAMDMPQGCGWWEGKGAGDKWDLHLPSLATWQRLKAYVPTLDGEWDWLIEWADAERAVIGPNPYNAVRGRSTGTHTIVAPQAPSDITAPATADAQRWQGWGTALKPAHEPIVVARKPLVGTVAANVQRWGTGALNVDGCRIGTTRAVPASHSKTASTVGAVGISGKRLESELDPNIGRWPANVALDETAAAALDRMSGELSSAGSAQGPQERWSPSAAEGWGSFGSGPGVAGARFGDAGGASRFFFVSRDQSDKLDPCPSPSSVSGAGSLSNRPSEIDGSAPRAANHEPRTDPGSLARSTSETPSGSSPTSGSDTPPMPSTDARSSPALPQPRPTPTSSPVSGAETPRPTDTTTTTANPLRSDGFAAPATSPTTSRSKEAGAPALPIDALGSRFTYTAKAGSDERITHNGVAHPTVKPLSLLRWLVRLVTPPGGVILEPFAGSGTTVEAAILEGFRCIAIEREADYLPLITQRINRRRDPVKYLAAAGEDLGLFDEDAS